jgi:hypothetical protein
VHRDPYEQAGGNRSGWGDPTPADSVCEVRCAPALSRGRPRHSFDFLRVLCIRHGEDFLLLGGVQRNIVGQFEMSKNLLAMGASYNVFFPGIQFFGEQRALVISSKRFRVRARIA